MGDLMALGILLFVLVYGPIVYMIYAELKRHGCRVWTRSAGSALQRGRNQMRAASHYQH
jgi:hypothetical protein